VRRRTQQTFANYGWKAALSSLYVLYKVTVNELEVLSAQAKCCGAVNKTPSEPTAQDGELGK
jgi:hypothetical protein